MDYCRRLDLGGGEVSRAADRGGDPRYALPGTEPRYAPDRAFDTTHIRLEIALHLRTRTATARCPSTLTALQDRARAVAFDAVGFRDLRVTGPSGRRLPHRYDGRRLSVTLPQTLDAGETVAIRVHYRVTRPRLGLHFVRPDRAYPRRPVQVWS